MDDALRKQAQAVIAALPASVEKPAGTGKTQLVAAIAAIAAEAGSRTLVLTHTHAGVDAIRQRLLAFGVPKSQVHIDTIAGWAFDLARSYPIISGVKIDDAPDWTQTPEYLEGAIRVAKAEAIVAMHAASFDYFVVDEYQDCVTEQHDLVLAIAAAIPETCVLGDRLQGIFGFRGQTLVNWEKHVAPNFPVHEQAHVPHRWADHNPELGQWLIDIRPTLMDNRPLDLSAVAVPGFSWVQSDQAALVKAAFAKRLDTESVLVLGQWRADADKVARLLNGMYGVMEDVQGNFMLDFLQKVDGADASQRAFLLAVFSKQCFSGLAGLDSSLMNRLAQGKTVGHLARAGLEPILAALDRLLADPSLEVLGESMTAFDVAAPVQLFKREAWIDVRKAIERAAVEGSTAVTSLARVRDSIRHTGRRPAKRVVSRTVLVKGLEYDHVIIADAAALGTTRNLYVALTRARKTLTVFGASGVTRYKT